MITCVISGLGGLVLMSYFVCAMGEVCRGLFWHGLQVEPSAPKTRHDPR